MLKVNERGAALPLVLIIMMVLGLLGATLVMYSVTETRHVALDEDNLKAHYLARSGAHAVAYHLATNPQDVNEYLYRDSLPTAFGDGTFTVKIFGDVESLFIEAVGSVNGAEQKVVLTMVGADIFEDPIISLGNVDISGAAKVFGGNVIYKGSKGKDVDKAIQGGFTAIHDPDVFYKDVVPPSCSDLTYMTSIDLKNNDVALIDEDSCVDSIKMSNGATLNIQLGTEADPENRILRAKSFNATGGDIVLIGYGIFLLYVDDSFDLTGNYIAEKPGHAYTAVFVGAGAEFKQSGGTNFTGIIYAPKVTYSGKGGGSITGSVIVGELDAGGNYDFTYHKFDTSGLPLGMYQISKWQYDF